MHCSFILSPKQLCVTAEGTLRGHIPAASGLACCFPGCGPKPVRFFNLPPSVARVPATINEKSPCATCIPAASGLGLCPSGCGLKPVRFFDHLSELFRCMNQGNQNGIEPEPSGQYWSASLFRCRCFCCCVQGAHFRPQFSKSTISCLPVQSPFESAWQYTVFWFS